MPSDAPSGAGTAFGIVGRKLALAGGSIAADTALPVLVMGIADGVERRKYTIPAATPANRTAFKSRTKVTRRGVVRSVVRAVFPKASPGGVAILRPSASTVFRVMAISLILFRACLGDGVQRLMGLPTTRDARLAYTFARKA